MEYGKESHFTISLEKYSFQVNNQEIFDDKNYYRQLDGVKHLCVNKLLGLNTLSSKSGNDVGVSYSYYWTSLGNDVLNLMKIIDEEELVKRRLNLPKFF